MKCVCFILLHFIPLCEFLFSFWVSAHDVYLLATHNCSPMHTTFIQNSKGDVNIIRIGLQLCCCVLIPNITFLILSSFFICTFISIFIINILTLLVRTHWNRRNMHHSNTRKHGDPSLRKFCKLVTFLGNELRRDFGAIEGGFDKVKSGLFELLLSLAKSTLWKPNSRPLEPPSNASK